MKMKTKQILLFITFGVVLFALSMNFSIALEFLKKILGLIFPIILGLIIAFVLNVPMSGIEKLLSKIFSKSKRKPKEAFLQGISLLLTFVCIALIITLACTLAIPQIISSAKSVYPLIESKLPEIITVLESYQVDLSGVYEWVSNLDWEKLSGSAENFINSAAQIATTTISGITSVVFGTVIAIYVLLSKKALAVQVKKLTYANFDKKIADRLCYIAQLVRETYTKFLSGQCVEAILLGCLIFLAFSIFRIPYAGLIGFLTGIFAFVPYVGAFASCFIGAFLILLAAPEKVILCIIVYLAVQFIENQFIYPHVVGTSVGLSPLWTLIAAMIGGKMFGLAGIIFFIPLTASLYSLLRDNTNRKLEGKKLLDKPETSAE